MDRRSWPWKKKSSEKAANTIDVQNASLSNSNADQVEQVETKTVNYIQISVESYAHLIELEDQVKILNEKLSSTQTELTAKERLVKQHAKVAEEAVSGWEKAESEAATLKAQLESVTLLKLTAEERAAHLDTALKECMKQIRNVKEEGEQKLHDVVFAKTKQWEKVKAELEEKITDFEEELLRASAENAALSRSLQERSNFLMKISDEKAQAESEIELLKSNIQSFEREISSSKYEIHVVTKELEIRNEEKNMIMRSAEVVNKQHLEDVKKIAKLEAECQRLRGLVRKKLPGPASLAQMKLEVENLGRDYGDTRLRRSPDRSFGMYHVSPAVPDYAFENIQQLQKENDFLTERLLAMEEETKMLKEALTKRNSELQVSRIKCAKATNRLHNIEAQMQAFNQHSSPSKLYLDNSLDATLSQHESNAPSLISMSEAGMEEGCLAESWVTALVSELTQLRKQKEVQKPDKTDNPGQIELMDDFLEMERLACLSTESNGAISSLASTVDSTKTGSPDVKSSNDAQKDEGIKERQLNPENTGSILHSSENQYVRRNKSNDVDSALENFKLRISTILSRGGDVDIDELLEDIRKIIEDTQDGLPQGPVSCIIEETHSLDVSCDEKHCHENAESVENCVSVNNCNDSCADSKDGLDHELKNAIREIHEFVLWLGKGAMEVQERELNAISLFEKTKEFSSYVNEFTSNEGSMHNVILILSQILSEASNISFYFRINECNDNSDYVDKATLLENKVALTEPRKNNLSSFSDSSSHPEIEGPTVDNCEVNNATLNVSMEDFEQMKVEHASMEMELASYTRILDETKLQLVETEQKLEDLKSQLAASQKSNSLAETQLKCMAESYKLLESRMLEMEAEVVMLRRKEETLNEQLQNERRVHQDDLAKCKDLQEQIERREKCSMCSHSDSGVKVKQEQEIAAAAEKLAECQESIILLGRQLQALRPPAEQHDSSSGGEHLTNDDSLSDMPDASGYNADGTARHSGQSDTESSAAFVTSKSGGNSPLNGNNFQVCPSENETSNFPSSPISTKGLKQRSSGSSSISSSEKPGRGFSRFFSKGKSEH